MNDDDFDDLLAQGAREYNAPGAVPREEMWARITAARAAQRGAMPSPDLTTTRRLARTPIWLGAAVAAGLLLWVGVTVGRRVERNRTRTVASTPPSVAPRIDAPSVAATDSPATTSTHDRDSIVTALQHETQHTARRVRELASAPAPSSPARRDDDTRALADRLVVMQHLAGSEAMITAFRSSAHRGAIDAQIASWSRDLLSTTRLLETSSTAAQDPTMRRLLEDLDLVISQIVQYTTRGRVDADDLDLIEQSIATRGVMNKLRTLPGRTAPVGT